MIMLDNTDYPSSLPETWSQVRHEEIAFINPKLNSEEISDELEVSFLPMAAIEEKTGRFNLSDVRQYGKVKKGYTQFANGDLLFAKITPCMENGKVVVVGNLVNGIGCGSTEFHVSRPIDLVNRKYLFFYFVQEAFRRDAQRNMTGSAGQLRVPKSFFAEARIPFPPLAEQQRIVDKIEELFSDLDSGIDSLKTAQRQLKVYRQAVLKWAFEGKLTAQWREEQRRQGKLESADALLAKINAERSQRYQKELGIWQAEVEAWDANGKEEKKPRKPKKPKSQERLIADDLKDFPSLPNDWQWVRVDQLGDVQLGRQRSPKNRSKDYPTKYVRAANITESGLDLSDVLDMEFSPDERRIYELKSGDIILSEASGSANQAGKPAMWRNQLPCCCFQNTVIRLRPYVISSEYILKAFKNYYFNGIFANVASGVGINHLSANKFSAIPFPVAPPDEQLKIVEELETRFSICDRLEADIETNLKKAEALRQSVLKQAFEGKLVPQDPNDEPALVLLERIRAERKAQKAQSGKAKTKTKAKRVVS